MEYKGKLYGKIGNKYFDTSHTAEDWDKLIDRVKELEQKLQGSNTDLLHNVSQCPLCGSDDLFQYKLQHIHCQNCNESFNKGCD